MQPILFHTEESIRKILEYQKTIHSGDKKSQKDYILREQEIQMQTGALLERVD